MISYQIEKTIAWQEFREVLISSGLGERRPIEDAERLQAMLAQADLLVTARDSTKLVGIARSLTDFVYCTYLSDLAVDEDYQKQGIGKELIRQTKLAAPQAKLILLAAPKAIKYYPRIGMQHHPHCYTLDDISDLGPA
jgi:predicted N-acetyltransferase YhbS